MFGPFFKNIRIKPKSHKINSGAGGLRHGGLQKLMLPFYLECILKRKYAHPRFSNLQPRTANA